MAQVRKFQDGTTQGGITKQPTVSQQKKYKLKVDGRDFEVDDDALDTHFDNAFKDLVDKGYAKEDDRADWYNNYKDFKEQLNSGAEIDMTGQSLGALNLKGDLSNEQLGLDESGKAARSSRFGRFVRGGVKDASQRNALLHGMLGQSIGQSATLAREESEKKTKEEAETAKKKHSEEIDKLVSRLDPSKRGFGVNYFGEQEGADADFNTKYFWDDKKSDVDRNYMYGKAMANFGKELFSNKYDNEEVISAAKAKGIDIASLRNAFTSKGFNAANADKFAEQYKTKGIKGFEDFHNTLDILKSDYGFYNKPVAPVATTTGTTAATTNGATQVVDAETKTDVDTKINQQPEKTGWTMSEGTLMKDGKPFTGFRYHAPFSSSNAYYINGAPAKKSDVDAFVSKNPRYASHFQNTYKDAIQKDVDYVAQHGFTKLEKKEGAYRPKTFAFNDMLKNSGDTYAKDTSMEFTGVDEKKGRLFEYITFKGTGDNAVPVRGYRYYDRVSNKYYDGFMKKDPVTGNFTFISKDGRFKTGVGAINTNMVSSEALSKRRQNLYFDDPTKSLKQEFFEGLENIASGKKKMQYGGDLQRAVGAVKGTEKARTTATTKDVGNLNLSSADKWKLTGLATDLAGLGFSMTGAGSLVGAGLGIGGSTASFVADLKQDRDTGEAVGDYAKNLGLDVLSAVPVLGIANKVPKVAKALKASKNLLNAYFITQGLSGAAQSLRKIDDPSNMTIDDWRNILGGVQAVLSGKRAVDSSLATKTTKTSSIKANGKTVVLDEGHVNTINSAKGKAAQMEAARNIAAEKLGIKPEEVNLESTSKGLSFNASFNPLKMVGLKEKPSIIETSTKGLKDINDYTGKGFANWYMRSAIRNTAFMNPSLPGSEALLAPRYQKNEKGEYVQVFEGSKGGPSWLGSRFNTYIDKKGNVWKAAAAEGNAANAKTNAANARADKFGLPEKGTVKPQQPDVVKGKPVVEQPKYKNTWREDLANEIASRRESRSAASERLEKSKSALGEYIGQERLTRSSARISSINAKDKARKIKELEGSNKRATAEATVDATTVKKSDGKRVKLSPSQKKTLSKIRPENRQKFIDQNFKDGGVLKAFGGLKITQKPKSQSKAPAQAGVKKQANPIQSVAKIDFTPRTFSDKPMSKINLSTPAIKQDYSKFTPKYSLTKEQTPVTVDYMPTQTKLTKEFAEKNNQQSKQNESALNVLGLYNQQKKNLITGNSIPDKLADKPTADTGAPIGSEEQEGLSQAGFDTPESTSSIKDAIRNVSKHVNPIDVLELGRAAFISRHNAGEDTNVKATILQQPLELPSSIRGNLMLKSGFDKRASDIIQSGKDNMTSDSALNKLYQLSLNKQATEVRNEGALRDAEAIDRSTQAAEEKAQGFANLRSDIANRNISSLTAADEAKRQLKNVVRNTTVAPFEDFWMNKNQQLKNKQEVMDRYKAQSGIAKLQRKYSKEIGEAQRVIDSYGAGYRANTLTPEQKVAFEKAYENMNNLQSKINEESMNIYMNPNSVESPTVNPILKSPSSRGFSYIPAKASGGKVDREVEMYKEKAKTARDNAKAFNKSMSEKLSDRSKGEGKSRDRIQQLIMKAIK